MAGFTSLNVGVMGLKAAQTALNTTSHNLANVYTEGYVRQTTSFSDTNYVNLGGNKNMQVGLGVNVSETSRVRDILLDIQYRKDVGKQGFYNEQYETVQEVETFFGETEGSKFQNELESLYTAISEVANQPGNDVAKSELVMNAQSFLKKATSVYDSLINYQETLDTKVNDTVDRINELGNTIYTLNNKISSIEGPGIEEANDLRDQRDNALDELASLVEISYKEDENSIVTVKVEGVPFVLNNSVWEMGTAQLNGADGSNYLTAVWPSLDNKPVFNLDVEISSSKDNDIGSLKGLLLARGNYIADYTDVPKEEDFGGDTIAYQAAVDKYNLEIDSSVIMKTQALFDQLVNGIVTMINDVLCPNTQASFSGTDGNTYTNVSVLDTSTCSIDEATGDIIIPEELFTRTGVSRYTPVTSTTLDSNGNNVIYYVYNKPDVNAQQTLYTSSNLEMNQEILADYSKLTLTTSEGEEDRTKGNALLSKWESVFSNLDPNNLTKKNFNDYYAELIYEIGNTGSLYNSISVSYATSVSTTDNSRQQITGVSSEEELSNMVKFQSAYNASSRYINVIDEMLEHIIMNLN